MGQKQTIQSLSILLSKKWMKMKIKLRRIQMQIAVNVVRMERWSFFGALWNPACLCINHHSKIQS
jgi:hypothetical protein